MYSDHSLQISRLIIAGTTLGTVAWFAILFIEGAPVQLLLDGLLRLGIVVSVLTVAWTQFSTSAWRWKIFRLGGWLVRTPDLNGRWEGSYTSSYDNKKRPYTLEIRQTLTHLNCRVWGDGNELEIYSAHLLSNRDDSEFMISFLYQARRYPQQAVAGDQHDGCTWLRLIEGNPREVSGLYVNNRDPDPRKAKVEATWVSTSLKGRP